MLELADDEFSAIRKELEAYSKSLATDIMEHPETVRIDKVSLQNLLASDSSPVVKLSKVVAEEGKAKLIQPDADFIERRIQNLKDAQIYTVSDLEHLSLNHLEKVRLFARKWLEGSRHTNFQQGVGILYLIYVILAERGNKQEIGELLKKWNFGRPSEIADRIIKTYSSI